MAGKGIAKASGTIPESEALRRGVYDLFVAFSGQRAGATPLALASWRLECPELWERPLALPLLSTFRGTGPLFLGSGLICLLMACSLTETWKLTPIPSPTCPGLRAVVAWSCYSVDGHEEQSM